LLPGPPPASAPANGTATQSRPLKVGETFFDPPAGAPDKAGHGFWKVLSIEPAAGDVDAAMKAVRIEASGP
jgi:hypothetical protein